MGLFGRIAPVYDLLNRLLTLGIDRSWRRRLVAGLGLPPGARVLDVAAGTGDVAREIDRAGYRVVALDFCLPMLQRLGPKAPSIPATQADALLLPFPDGSFDAVSVAFGVRNFEDTHAGLAELARALRPGGTLHILEFGVPGVPGLRHLYLAYFRFVLPAVGRLVSRDPGAYRYLRDTVLQFPYGDAFADRLKDAGLTPSETTPLTGGICWLYRALKPPRTEGAQAPLAARG